MKKSILTLILLIILAIPFSAISLEHNSPAYRWAKELSEFNPIPKSQTSSYFREMVLSGFQEQFYSNNAWQNDIETQLEYNEFGRIIAITKKHWDSDSQAWVNDRRSEISYRINGSPNHVTMYFWDGTDWFHAGDTNFNYMGNVILSIVSELDIEGEVIELLSVNFTYNSSFTLLNFYIMNMNLFDTTISTKIQFLWDGLGRPSFVTTYNRNLAMEWEVEDRTQVFYHEEDSSNYQIFINYLLFSYAYEGDIYPISTIFKIQEELTHTFENTFWIPSSRLTYQYDTQVRLIQENEYYYDGDDWVVSAITDYSYNEEAYLSMWVYSQLNGSTPNPENRVVYIYDPVSNSDELGTPAISMNIKIYPNPFNPNTNISLELKEAQNLSLAVYNTRGQLVRNLANTCFSAGKHNFGWNGSDESGRSMPSGIYFLRAQAGNSSQSTKLILMK